MATVNLTTIAELEQAIQENDIVVLDFWAEWCGPCKMFGPIFTEAAENNSDILFAKVNTEQAQELSAAFDITSIPTLGIFRENIMVFKQPGMLPKEALNNLITQVKELNMNHVRAEIKAQEKVSA